MASASANLPAPASPIASSSDELDRKDWRAPQPSPPSPKAKVSAVKTWRVIGFPPSDWWSSFWPSPIGLGGSIAADGSVWFDDPMSTAERGVGQRRNKAAGPTNLNALHSVGLPQTYQHPRVVARSIATTALDLTMQDAAAGVDHDSRADRRSVGPGPDEFQADPWPVATRSTIWLAWLSDG